MIEKKLKSKRKVFIREMSIDAIDECKDSIQILFDNKGLPSTVVGLNKQKTLWIRKGLSGGDFKTWKGESKLVPDSVIKELTETEKDELSSIIQECQDLGE